MREAHAQALLSSKNVGFGDGNVGAAILSVAYWLLFVTRGDRWARACVARKFGVTITIASRGLWKVTGGRSALGALGIELLQLVVYFGAFAGWSVLMLAAVVASSYLERR